MYYKEGQIYNSQQAIRNAMKDTSLPMFMNDSLIESLGFQVIVEGAKPVPSDVQTVIETGVMLIDGIPTREYALQDMFSDTPENSVTDITPAVLDVDGVTVITPEVVTVTVISPAKTKLEYETEYLASIAKAQVPAVVTMRQARLALLEATLLDDVELAISTGTDAVMKIEWEYATEVQRDWASLNALSTSLGITSTQLDALFISAASK